MVTAFLKKLFFSSTCLLAIGAFSVGCAKKVDDAVIEAPSYFGSGANEASFSFDARIIVPESTGKPTEHSIYNSVKYAMKFVLGSVHNNGSVYAGFKIKVNDFETLPNGDYKVFYNLSGKGVFKKDLTSIKFNIPITPDKLWSLSKYKCHQIDEETDEGNFWYTWDPEKNQCPLVKDEHWYQAIVQLVAMPATADTYPEYERLIVDNQLQMTMYFGAADHDNVNWNPLDPKLKDQGARSYMQMRDYLVKTLGYASRVMPTDEISSNYSLRPKLQMPFAEELIKVTPKGNIRIRLFFLETAYLNDNSAAFHYILRNSVKNEAVILYDGHSGIGRNLNLDRIETNNGFKISFNTNYQVIYFGSCLPYAYYTDLFFKRKITDTDPNGTKNLDILAYAKEAHFGNVENLRLVLAFDDYMLKGIKTSYQKIITETPKDFFGVIGDEDNNMPQAFSSAIPGLNIN
ncbi:MAG: hypothetical protein H7235_05530 [Bdellovibrionaceae bacterium]|nr:hypothetical protein [Pseudobdellovibrionaceae bacterium]